MTPADKAQRDEKWRNGVLHGRFRRGRAPFWILFTPVLSRPGHHRERIRAFTLTGLRAEEWVRSV